MHYGFIIVDVYNCNSAEIFGILIDPNGCLDSARSGAK